MNSEHTASLEVAAPGDTQPQIINAKRVRIAKFGTPGDGSGPASGIRARNLHGRSRASEGIGLTIGLLYGADEVYRPGGPPRAPCFPTGAFSTSYGI